MPLDQNPCPEHTRRNSSEPPVRRWTIDINGACIGLMVEGQTNSSCAMSLPSTLNHRPSTSSRDAGGSRTHSKLRCRQPPHRVTSASNRYSNWRCFPAIHNSQQMTCNDEHFKRLRRIGQHAVSMSRWVSESSICSDEEGSQGILLAFGFASIG